LLGFASLLVSDSSAVALRQLDIDREKQTA
jgi:hypothetical protein